jgi:MYXO-CTERM domain-containing protein
VHALVLSAIISTLPLEGDVTADGGDYVLIPFEVPEGTVEIHFQHTDNSEADILDFGLQDPSGQRGWCGGLTDDGIIGVEESSRCYLPGPIEGGSTWYVDLGKAKLANPTVHYNITLEFHDAPVLEPRVRVDFEPRVLETGERWYAGDFHVHSSESGDATATFEEIYDLARDRGLDFVNLSDHNTTTQHALVAPFQAEVDDFLFLRGSEVTTYGGHGNTVGNTSYIEHHIGRDGHDIQALLEQVEEQGAMLIVNHPKLDLGDVCIGCAWSYEDTPWDKVAAVELQTGSYSIWPLFGASILRFWDDLLDEGHHVTGVSGSDDHRATREPEGIDGQIGTPTSMVRASELSEAAIMEGVRAGRVVVKLRGPDDPDLDLTAETDGGESGRIGDTVTGGRVSLTATAQGASGMSLILVRNGEEDEIVEVDSDDFTHVFERDTATDGDRYRVHLALTAEVVITNHIWVEYATPVPVPGPDAEDSGCGCRSGGGSSGGTLIFLVAAAALGLRRRRSRR